VVIGGVPRYGDTTLMQAAAAAPTFAMTVAGRRRLVSLPAPTDPNAAWSWDAILSTLVMVQRDPQSAIANAQQRAARGPRFAPDAELELFLDMPDTRRTGRAGPPKNPATVKIPEVQPIEHDTAFFDLLEKAPIPNHALDPLRGWYQR
jgi:hypothetical protein